VRLLSSSQGRASRRHYVPDGQFVALCGFLPGLNSGWRQPRRSARTCTDCHRLHVNNHGINYSNAKIIGN